MKHIKSYDDYLLEAKDKAKEIEAQVVKTGKVKDKEKELADDAEESKAKSTPRAEQADKAASKKGDHSANTDRAIDAAKDEECGKDAPKEPKKQGYDDEEDESLGMRTGKEAGKKQSDKARREDSYGKWGTRDKKNEAEGFRPSDDGRTISLDEKCAKNEDHEQFDDKVLNMGLGEILSIMKKKDPKGYSDMEGYIKKNFSKSADESWFTTMTA